MRNINELRDKLTMKNGKYIFTTEGICAKQIIIELNDDDLIEDISFSGGCSGNGKAVNMLCKNRSIDEVIEAVMNVTCGNKDTSCTMQLAEALTLIKELL